MCTFYILFLSSNLLLLKTIAYVLCFTGVKPKLSLSQIINMSVGFFGIQFAFGLQNANVSRIFQTLGANIDDIPILWIAAPLTGLDRSTYYRSLE